MRVRACWSIVDSGSAWSPAALRSARAALRTDTHSGHVHLDGLGEAPLDVGEAWTRERENNPTGRQRGLRLPGRLTRGRG